MISCVPFGQGSTQSENPEIWKRREVKEEGREMCLFYRQGIAGLSYRQLAKTMDTGELLGETSLSLLAYPK